MKKQYRTQSEEMNAQVEVVVAKLQPEPYRSIELAALRRHGNNQ